MSKVSQTELVTGSRRLAEFWTAEQKRVEETLAEHLQTPPDGSERLYSAMRHAALAPAKRLRPILCIATHRTLGGDNPQVYRLAAAIEMLHTYSLIHDDLPCMDDDDERRGRPTVHVAFDEATAVLAGDALQASAFQMIGSIAAPNLVWLLARAIGPEGMAGGQMADLEAEGQEPTEQLVTEIHVRKTGRLIDAAIAAGAFLCPGITTGTMNALGRYGRALGLAFQIVDDTLELTQTAAKLGKPVGSDLKHRKVTYPAAVGLDRSLKRAQELADEAKQALGAISADSTLLCAIADFIVARDR